ncbi:BTAD domain-containing putative transcriptional regulator [Crossiella sp. CA-258035]|uniref:AfsR/SARP family transcriptional regulator n=1 Tax=Crossiella sp. CA-258035 TaxID=2981138 RepID=UPI0024BCD4B8|nr:AfsR/SARP family transcriptional regulator [Crossiella sp. CA-258035]WHT23340.1 BTAD domain-containing putative transcriptional regulator [Crossiella sp. CA-258035]
MDFRVLGPLEIVYCGRNIIPTAAKPRQVASLLTLRRNALVQTGELIDELWEDNPPSSAMTTLQTYIYKLRRILAECEAGDILSTWPGGYKLFVPDEALDLHRFEADASRGKELLDQGDAANASKFLEQALSVWRGPALVDVARGTLLSSYATGLEEQRARTLELRIRADFALGRYRETIGELKSLVQTHLLDEQLHAALMTALYHSGRRHEALELYQLHRGNVIKELGLEPGREIQRLHQSMLSDTSIESPFALQPAAPLEIGGVAPMQTVAQEEPRAAVTAEAALWPGQPAQLPPAIAEFTGRTAIRDEIEAEFTCPAKNATPVAVISGMPGVGKTALAIHIAHRLRTRFPDGQLYADLNGRAGTRRDVAELAHGLLTAMGVTRHQMPDTAEERGKLFRSITAGRRILLLLDNVPPVDLSAVLPGDPQCGVIVTSRSRLFGLAGSRRVDLEVLSRGEALDLLIQLVGRSRIDTEEQAAADLIESEFCRHPLALRCIGSRLVANPTLSLRGVAKQISRPAHLFDELPFEGLDIRARFDSSYRAMDRETQGIFRLLAMFPAGRFPAEAAADLLGRDLGSVKRALAYLEDHHLLRMFYEEDGNAQFAFPELVWCYAREKLDGMLQLCHQGTRLRVFGGAEDTAWLPAGCAGAA